MQADSLPSGPPGKPCHHLTEGRNGESLQYSCRENPMNSRERLPVGSQRVICIWLLPSSAQMVLLRRGCGALPITSLPPGPPSSPRRWPTSSGDPFRTEHLLEEDRSPPAAPRESRLSSFRSGPAAVSLWFHHKADLHPAGPWGVGHLSGFPS